MFCSADEGKKKVLFKNLNTTVNSGKMLFSVLQITTLLRPVCSLVGVLGYRDRWNQSDCRIFRIALTHEQGKK